MRSEEEDADVNLESGGFVHEKRVGEHGAPDVDDARRRRGGCSPE
jgi:hypothetical protein